MANSDKGAYEYLSIYSGDKYISKYGDNSDGNSWKTAYSKHSTALASADNNSTMLVYTGDEPSISEIGGILDLEINKNNLIFKRVPLTHAGIFRVKSIIGTNRSQVFDGYDFIASDDIILNSPVFYGLTFKNCSFTGFNKYLANNCKFINCKISTPNIDLPDLIYIKNSDFYNCEIDPENNDKYLKYLIYNDIYGVMYNSIDHYLTSSQKFLDKYYNVYALYNTDVVNYPEQGGIDKGNNEYAELQDYAGNPRIANGVVDSGATESGIGSLVRVTLDPNISKDNLPNTDTFTPVNGVVSPWIIYYYDNSNFDYLPIPYAGNNYLFLYWCIDSSRTQKIYTAKDLNEDNYSTTVGSLRKIYAKYLYRGEVNSAHIEIIGSDSMYTTDTEHYDVYLVGTYKSGDDFSYKLNYDLLNLSVITETQNASIYKGDLSVNPDRFNGESVVIKAELSNWMSNILTATKTVMILYKPIRIKFDSNDDEYLIIYKEFDSMIYTGRTFNILPGIQHKFKKFLGWFYSQTSGGTPVKVDSIIIRSRDTLYAHWENPSSIESIELAGLYHLSNKDDYGIQTINFDSYHNEVYLGNKDNYSVKLTLLDQNGDEYYTIATGLAIEKYDYDDIIDIDSFDGTKVEYWNIGNKETAFYDILSTIVDSIDHLLNVKLSLDLNNYGLNLSITNNDNQIVLKVAYTTVHFCGNYELHPTDDYLENFDYTDNPYIYPYPNMNHDQTLDYLILNPFSMGGYDEIGGNLILKGLPVVYAYKKDNDVFAYNWKLDKSKGHTSELLVTNDTIITDTYYIKSFDPEDFSKYKYNTYLILDSSTYLLRLNIYDEANNEIFERIVTNGYPKKLKLRVYTNDASWEVVKFDPQPGYGDDASMYIINNINDWTSGSMNYTDIEIPINKYYIGEDGVISTSTRYVDITFKTRIGAIEKTIRLVQTASAKPPADDKYIAGAYVDCYRGVDDELHGNSFSNPFKTIQYAIEHVYRYCFVNGVPNSDPINKRYFASVIVNDGIYYETIQIKELTDDLGNYECSYIWSVRGPEYTIIDAINNPANPVDLDVSIGLYGSSTEPRNIEYLTNWSSVISDDSATLPGFTLRGSNTSGILFTNPNKRYLVANSIISHNGSIGILNNTNTLNTVVLGSLIYKNRSNGLMSVISISNIISENEANGIGNSQIYSTLIFRNKSYGAINCNKILDSTITYNGNYGMINCSNIYNSIVYYNGNIDTGGLTNYSQCENIKASCITPLTGVTIDGSDENKNIRLEPQFENVEERDFHLNISSKLINNSNLLDYNPIEISGQALADLDKVIYYVYTGLTSKYPKNMGCYQYPPTEDDIYRKYRLLPKISVPEKEVENVELSN